MSLAKLAAQKTPRLAVRAVLLHEDRLLLVNAWPSPQSDLWCAPGGGVEPNQSLPDNLQRELIEETGLSIKVGPPCLVNEFHDPSRGFHQVEVFFRCHLSAPPDTMDRTDPEGVVTRRKWASHKDMETLRFRPASLSQIAWQRGFGYDPLEIVVR